MNQVQIKFDGTDVTSSVIAYDREKEICTGVGVLRITLKHGAVAPNLYKQVEIYEGGIKKGSYYVHTVDKDAPGWTQILNAQDGSLKLQSYFIPETYLIDYPSPSDYWIKKFCDESTVDYSFDGVTTGSLLSNNTSLGITTAMEAITPLLQQNGWYMSFDANNVAHIGKLAVDTGSYKDVLGEDAVISVSSTENDKMFRNRILVWGNGDPTTSKWIHAEINRSGMHQNEYGANDVRTVVIANSEISHNSDAMLMASRAIKEFEQTTREIMVDVAGARDIEIGDHVRIDTSYMQVGGIVTTVGSSLSSGGLVTHLVLNQRCPRLFAFFDFGGEVYVGTQDKGIWKKYIKYVTAWSNYSQGLTNLDIQDLSMANGTQACVAGGELYTRNPALAGWKKVVPSGFVTATGMQPYVSGMCIACSVDQSNDTVNALYVSPSAYGVPSGGMFVTGSGDGFSWLVQIPITNRVTVTGITLPDEDEVLGYDLEGIDGMTYISTVGKGHGEYVTETDLISSKRDRYGNLQDVDINHVDHPYVTPRLLYDLSNLGGLNTTFYNNYYFYIKGTSLKRVNMLTGVVDTISFTGSATRQLVIDADTTYLVSSGFWRVDWVGLSVTHVKTVSAGVFETIKYSDSAKVIVTIKINASGSNNQWVGVCGFYSIDSNTYFETQLFDTGVINGSYNTFDSTLINMPGNTMTGLYTLHSFDFGIFNYVRTTYYFSVNVITGEVFVSTPSIITPDDNWILYQEAGMADRDRHISYIREYLDTGAPSPNNYQIRVRSFDNTLNASLIYTSSANVARDSVSVLTYQSGYYVYDRNTGALFNGFDSTTLPSGSLVSPYADDIDGGVFYIYAQSVYKYKFSDNSTSMIYDGTNDSWSTDSYWQSGSTYVNRILDFHVVASQLHINYETRNYGGSSDTYRYVVAIDVDEENNHIVERTTVIDSHNRLLLYDGSKFTIVDEPGEPVKVEISKPSTTVLYDGITSSGTVDWGYLEVAPVPESGSFTSLNLSPDYFHHITDARSFDYYSESGLARCVAFCQSNTTISGESFLCLIDTQDAVIPAEDILPSGNPIIVSGLFKNLYIKPWYTFSGVATHIETTNTQDIPYFFVSTNNGSGSMFWQKDYMDSGQAETEFVDRTYNLPNSTITCIRCDDVL